MQELVIAHGSQGAMQCQVNVPRTRGVNATVAVPGESVKDVIKRADTLLYESKAAGRNCVTAR